MRLRFAPSPTGFLHIGNARTAIMNYLLSRKYNATLLLRVEDTDRERSTEESEVSIIKDLEWLGLSWHEGPHKGGDCGPYRQSERNGIYSDYTKKLLEEGNAYKCFCTQEELEVIRKEAEAAKKNAMYDGRCRSLTSDQVKTFEAESRSHTVRFKVPENETVLINDHIRGEVTFNSDNIGGDFIIVRSDGGPVYNYIVIIDDALMKVSHVVRGEDHLSNTPKQVLVGKALGLHIPHYAHLPLVLGPDKSKLSKRHGITSVDLYRTEGYLPEALVNYIAMLGWAHESGEEILSVDQIIEAIDIDNLAKSAAVFDFQKLRWVNSQYIKNMPVPEVTDLFMPYIIDAGYSLDSYDRETQENIIASLRNNCELLSDIPSWLDIFVKEVPEHGEDVAAVLKDEDAQTLIRAAHELIQNDLNNGNFASEIVNQIKEKTGLKGKKLFKPSRALLTCRLQGPDMDIALPLIGFEKCKQRIEYAFNTYCK